MSCKIKLSCSVLGISCTVETGYVEKIDHKGKSRVEELRELKGRDVVPNLLMEELVSKISKKRSGKGNDQWAINPGIKIVVKAPAKATSQAQEAYEIDADMHDITNKGRPLKGRDVVPN
ncbi:hypothetical protein Sjap_015022 [Stephania japonica]|uniref:Uncharacterized protein n=1 Tax=Stephania japonica TaxID=461633 RepID=A0AAP0IIT5_9MAGN